MTRDWPIVNMSKVSPNRWAKVYEDTVDIQTNPALSDAQDFSLRAMLQLMLTASVQRIEYVMEESLHLDQVKQIRELFLSDNVADRERASEEMKKFIDEFTKDMLAGY